MSWVEAGFVVLLVALAAFVKWAFGEEYQMLVFVGIAGIGVLGTLSRERLFRILEGRFRRLHQDWHGHWLTHLENVELRSELAARVGVEPPRVPIRGSEEAFDYPTATAPVMWFTGALAALIVPLPLLLLWLHHPSAVPLREGIWMQLTFGALAAYSFRVAWRTPMQVRVSEEGLSLWV